MKAQFSDLVARGHDPQLQIRPMWFFSPPPRDRRPRLDADKCDLSLLERSDNGLISNATLARVAPICAI